MPSRKFQKLTAFTHSQTRMSKAALKEPRLHAFDTLPDKHLHSGTR
jgi:hypothetical protein